MSNRKDSQFEYKSLYRRILEIGKDRINTGISYIDLTNILKSEGLSIDGCSSLAIKKFFCDNFYHAAKHDKAAPTPENLTRDHNSCNFVMTGESMLMLERFEELDAMRENNRISRRISFTAIGLSCVIAFFAALNYFKAGKYTDTLSKQLTPPQIETHDNAEVLLRLNYNQFERFLNERNLLPANEGDVRESNKTPNQSMKGKTKNE